MSFLDEALATRWSGCAEARRLSCSVHRLAAGVGPSDWEIDS